MAQRIFQHLAHKILRHITRYKGIANPAHKDEFQFAAFGLFVMTHDINQRIHARTQRRIDK